MLTIPPIVFTDSDFLNYIAILLNAYKMDVFLKFKTKRNCAKATPLG